MLNLNEKLKNFPLDWVENLIKKYPEAEIYLVGGAVRDFLINRDTKDLDFVIKNIKPNDLEKFLESQGKVNLVGKSFGVYKFNPKQNHSIELDITLPRTEHSFNTGGYKDVDVNSNYLLNIEEDLKRRDFTINAIALKLDIKNKKIEHNIIDPFNGQGDLVAKKIKTVGESEDRFQEDATRMLRAIRFACQLNFNLDKKIINTIKDKSDLIKKIAPERINTELDKIIMSENAELGFRVLQKLKILKIIIPELEQAVGVDQSRNHIYDVFEHSVRSLGFAAKKDYTLENRWASLLHDIGKPTTRAKQGSVYTFFNHEYAGAKITKKILKKFRYPDKIVDKVSHLVENHMFYYNTDEITDSAVRRLLRKIGPENIDDLVKIRVVDRLGMGRPKGKPFKLIELERRFKEISLDPLSVKMLKINGQDIIKELNIQPGPKIGLLLNALLNEVLEDPQKNTKEYLIKKLKELNKLDNDNLKKLTPNLEKYEEDRREKLIGKPLVFKGKKLDRLIRTIKK